MITYVVKCQVIAKECDILNYITLVFKTLENNCPFGHKYCMVVVFPNWESYVPDIGESGFLQYDEVEAGKDTYYDRNLDSIVKYNYSNLIFKRFVREVDSSKKEIII